MIGWQNIVMRRRRIAGQFQMREIGYKYIRPKIHWLGCHVVHRMSNAPGGRLTVSPNSSSNGESMGKPPHTSNKQCFVHAEDKWPIIKKPQKLKQECLSQNALKTARNQKRLSMSGRRKDSKQVGSKSKRKCSNLLAAQVLLLMMMAPKRSCDKCDLTWSSIITLFRCFLSLESWGVRVIRVIFLLGK